MRRAVAASRALRVAVIACAVLLALLVIAQLALPRIAASTIESRVGRYGSVRQASVSAWPALELLWGSASSVTVRAGALRLTPAQTAKLLWEGHGVARIDASAAAVQEGPLRLADARFTQRGDRLHGEAAIGRGAVRAALPAGVDVQLLASGGGQVRVRVTGGLFGAGGSVDAVALAEGGALVVRPLGSGFAGLRLTLFSDAHVYVEGVGARATPGGYELSMDARLR